MIKINDDWRMRRYHKRCKKELDLIYQLKKMVEFDQTSK